MQETKGNNKSRPGWGGTLAKIRLLFSLGFSYNK